MTEDEVANALLLADGGAQTTTTAELTAFLHSRFPQLPAGKLTRPWVLQSQRWVERTSLDLASSSTNAGAVATQLAKDTSLSKEDIAVLRQLGEFILKQTREFEQQQEAASTAKEDDNRLEQLFDLYFALDTNNADARAQIERLVWGELEIEEMLLQIASLLAHRKRRRRKTHQEEDEQQEEPRSPASEA